MRTSCKKHARELVPVHFSELSPDAARIQVWALENSHLVHANMARTKKDLIVLYRKAKVADLTGVANGERKAKFIYDLDEPVGCTVCFSVAALILPPLHMPTYSPTTIATPRFHTAILSSSHLSSRPSSWVTVLVD